jgi:hypothetical protein
MAVNFSSQRVAQPVSQKDEIILLAGGNDDKSWKGTGQLLDNYEQGYTISSSNNGPQNNSSNVLNRNLSFLGGTWMNNSSSQKDEFLIFRFPTSVTITSYKMWETKDQHLSYPPIKWELHSLTMFGNMDQFIHNDNLDPNFWYNKINDSTFIKKVDAERNADDYGVISRKYTNAKSIIDDKQFHEYKIDSSKRKKGNILIMYFPYPFSRINKDLVKENPAVTIGGLAFYGIKYPHDENGFLDTTNNFDIIGIHEKKYRVMPVKISDISNTYDDFFNILSEQPWYNDIELTKAVTNSAGFIKDGDELYHNYYYTDINGPLFCYDIDKKSLKYTIINSDKSSNSIKGPPAKTNFPRSPSLTYKILSLKNSLLTTDGVIPTAGTFGWNQRRIVPGYINAVKKGDGWGNPKDDVRPILTGDKNDFKYGRHDGRRLGDVESRNYIIPQITEKSGGALGKLYAYHEWYNWNEDDSGKRWPGPLIVKAESGPYDEFLEVTDGNYVYGHILNAGGAGGARTLIDPYTFTVFGVYWIGSRALQDDNRNGQNLSVFNHAIKLFGYNNYFTNMRRGSSLQGLGGLISPSNYAGEHRDGYAMWKLDENYSYISVEFSTNGAYAMDDGVSNKMSTFTNKDGSLDDDPDNDGPFEIQRATILLAQNENSTRRHESWSVGRQWRNHRDMGLFATSLEGDRLGGGISYKGEPWEVSWGDPLKDLPSHYSPANNYKTNSSMSLNIAQIDGYYAEIGGETTMLNSVYGLEKKHIDPDQNHFNVITGRSVNIIRSSSVDDMPVLSTSGLPINGTTSADYLSWWKNLLRRERSAINLVALILEAKDSVSDYDTGTIGNWRRDSEQYVEDLRSSMNVPVNLKNHIEAGTQSLAAPGNFADATNNDGNDGWNWHSVDVDNYGGPANATKPFIGDKWWNRDWNGEQNDFSERFNKFNELTRIETTNTTKIYSSHYSDIESGLKGGNWMMLLIRQSVFFGFEVTYYTGDPQSIIDLSASWQSDTDTNNPKDLNLSDNHIIMVSYEDHIEDLSIQTNLKVIENKYYLFNYDGIDTSFNYLRKYGLKNNTTYTLIDIPEADAIRIVNKDSSPVNGAAAKQEDDFIGVHGMNSRTNSNGDIYYYGDVTVNVLGNFGQVSIESIDNSYINGEYLFQYNEEDWHLKHNYIQKDLIFSVDTPLRHDLHHHRDDPFVWEEDYLTKVLFDGFNPTEITDNQFKNNFFSDISFGNSNISVIGEYAFSTTDDRPDIRESIPPLTLVIPNTVNYIREGAFMNCKIHKLTLGNNVTHIEAYAFKNCNISTLIIPGSVTTICGEAFTNNNITSLIIPNTVTNLGLNAFTGNNITKLSVPRHLYPRGFTNGWNHEAQFADSVQEWKVVDGEWDLYNTGDKRIPKPWFGYTDPASLYRDGTGRYEGRLIDDRDDFRDYDVYERLWLADYKVRRDSKNPNEPRTRSDYDGPSFFDISAQRIDYT